MQRKPKIGSLKTETYKGQKITFYRSRNGWVRTHIFKGKKLVSAFDAKTKKVGFKNAKRLIKHPVSHRKN